MKKKVLFVVEKSWCHRLILQHDFGLEGYDVRVVSYSYNDPQPLEPLGGYDILITPFYFLGGNGRNKFQPTCRGLKNIDGVKTIALIPNSMRGIWDFSKERWNSQTRSFERVCNGEIFNGVIYTPCTSSDILTEIKRFN